MLNSILTSIGRLNDRLNPFDDLNIKYLLILFYICTYMYEKFEFRTQLN